jgi:hypothetical protein
VNVTTSADWELFAGENRLNLLSGGGSVSASGSVAPFGSVGGLPPPDTFVAWEPSISTPSQQITLYSDFADFVGNGSVTLFGEANVQTSWTSDPTDLPLVWTNAPAPGSRPGGSISGNLTYTFSPVPEPSASALLGIGVVSVLTYTWRRRR